MIKEKNKKNRRIWYIVLGSMVFLASVVAVTLTIQIMFFGMTYKNANGEIIIGKMPGDDDLSVDGPYILKSGNAYKTIYVGNAKKENEVSEQNITDPYMKNWVCRIDSKMFHDSFFFNLNNAPLHDSSEYALPSRLLVISDIEGNFFALKTILQANHVIDSQFNWRFGNGHLLLLGDMVDRGRNVTQCLWLAYKLEQEASKAGGKVHFINGNHEEMNYRGNVTYVQPKYRALAARLKVPYKDLFSGQSLVAGWMRSKNVIVKIGDILFCHGGIHPDILKFSPTLQQINAAAAENFGVDHRTLVAKTSLAGFIFSSKGVMWYRGFFTGTEDYAEIAPAELSRICDYFKVSRIVVGHTIQEDIIGHAGGRVIGVDVVQPTEAEPGPCKALLIESDKYYRVLSDGSRAQII